MAGTNKDTLTQPYTEQVMGWDRAPGSTDREAAVMTSG